jgi:hypothetical protein
MAQPTPVPDRLDRTHRDHQLLVLGIELDVINDGLLDAQQITP